MQKSTAPLSSATRHLAPTESSSDLTGYQKPEDPVTASPQMPAAPGPDLHMLPYSFLPSDPGQWNIEDVYEFISSLPGRSRAIRYL